MLEKLLKNKIDIHDLSDKQMKILVEDICKVDCILTLIHIKCIFTFEKNNIKKRLDYLSNYIGYDGFLEEKRKQKRFILLNQIIHKIDLSLDNLEYIEELN